MSIIIIMQFLIMQVVSCNMYIQHSPTQPKTASQLNTAQHSPEWLQCIIMAAMICRVADGLMGVSGFWGRLVGWLAESAFWHSYN